MDSSSSSPDSRNSVSHCSIIEEALALSLLPYSVESSFGRLNIEENMPCPEEAEYTIDPDQKYCCRKEEDIGCCSGGVTEEASAVDYLGRFCNGAKEKDAAKDFDSSSSSLASHNSAGCCSIIEDTFSLSLWPSSCFDSSFRSLNIEKNMAGQNGSENSINCDQKFSYHKEETVTEESHHCSKAIAGQALSVDCFGCICNSDKEKDVKGFDSPSSSPESRNSVSHCRMIKEAYSLPLLPSSFNPSLHCLNIEENMASLNEAETSVNPEQKYCCHREEEKSGHCSEAVTGESIAADFFGCVSNSDTENGMKDSETLALVARKDNMDSVVRACASEEKYWESKQSSLYGHRSPSSFSSFNPPLHSLNIKGKIAALNEEAVFNDEESDHCNKGMTGETSNVDHLGCINTNGDAEKGAKDSETIALLAGREAMDSAVRVCNSEEEYWTYSESKASPSSSSLSPHRQRRFPPPLRYLAETGLSDIPNQMPRVFWRSIKCQGRFVLQEAQCTPRESLQSFRSNGRLQLQLIRQDRDRDGHSLSPRAPPEHSQLGQNEDAPVTEPSSFLPSMPSHDGNENRKPVPNSSSAKMPVSNCGKPDKYQEGNKEVDFAVDNAVTDEAKGGGNCEAPSALDDDTRQEGPIIEAGQNQEIDGNHATPAAADIGLEGHMVQTSKDQGINRNHEASFELDDDTRQEGPYIMDIRTDQGIKRNLETPSALDVIGHKGPIVEARKDQGIDRNHASPPALDNIRQESPIDEDRKDQEIDINPKTPSALDEIRQESITIEARKNQEIDGNQLIPSALDDIRQESLIVEAKIDLEIDRNHISPSALHEIRQNSLVVEAIIDQNIDRNYIFPSALDDIRQENPIVEARKDQGNDGSHATPSVLVDIRQEGHKIEAIKDEGINGNNANPSPMDGIRLEGPIIEAGINGNHSSPSILDGIVKLKSPMVEGMTEGVSNSSVDSIEKEMEASDSKRMEMKRETVREPAWRQSHQQKTQWMGCEDILLPTQTFLNIASFARVRSVVG